MRKFYLQFLFCLIAVIPGFSQHQDNNKREKNLLYDDWTVTVESNANRNKSPKDVSLNFVPIGTTWDHRGITYFFQNGTNDIAGNNERQAIRDAFALWSAQTDLYFLEVCTTDDADIVFFMGGVLIMVMLGLLMEKVAS
jgi:hypothetical protein